jgi:Tfp pilus assembly major pilin PilA
MRKAEGFEIKKPMVNLKMHTASSGFTLTELMIFIAVITIILTMAIPAYSTYLIRLNIYKSLTVTSSAKRSIIFSCQEDPALTFLSNRVIDYKFEATKYVSNIVFSGTCNAPTITMTTQATGAQPDPVLTITGNSTDDTRRMTWLCVSDGLNSHVPETCRS